MFCALIDPFALSGLWSRAGINEKKFSYFMREGFIKPYQIEKVRPKTVLLGNSVVNTGFDLADPFFAEQPVYSMGMAGMGIYGNYRILQNLEADQHVVWVLDFWSFLGTNTGNDPQVIDGSDFGKRLALDRGGAKNYAQFWQSCKDRALLLLSWDAVAESLLTILQQSKQGWHLLRDGSWGGAPGNQGKSQQKAFQYMEKILLADLYAASRNKDVFSVEGARSSLDYFASALEWIYTHHQHAVLIIPPAHARWYEVLFRLERWQDYRRWKHQLVADNERLANQFGVAPLPLWDFSGYSRFATEPVPDWQDRESRIRYFSDGVHFTRELGGLMLRRIGGDAEMAEDFGVLLNGANVDAQLETMAEQHRQYKQAQADQWQAIWQSCLAVFVHQQFVCHDLHQ